MRINKLNLFVIVAIGLLPFAVGANKCNNKNCWIANDCNLMTSYSVLSSNHTFPLPKKIQKNLEVSSSTENNNSTSLIDLNELVSIVIINPSCSLKLRSGDYEKTVFKDCLLSELDTDNSNQFINKVSNKYNASQLKLEGFFVFDRITRKCLKSKLFHKLKFETF